MAAVHTVSAREAILSAEHSGKPLGGRVSAISFWGIELMRSPNLAGEEGCCHPALNLRPFDLGSNEKSWAHPGFAVTDAIFYRATLYA